MQVRYFLEIINIHLENDYFRAKAVKYIVTHDINAFRLNRLTHLNFALLV